MPAEPLRVLGIDPGLRATGYGVIEADGDALRCLDHGCIRPGAGAVPERLGRLFEGLCVVLRTHAVRCAAIETAFVAANPGTALKLGQARGALISACIVGGAEVHEYAPSRMKLALTGRGQAGKEQVQYMVRALLGLAAAPQADAADALGFAICHAHSRPRRALEAAA